MVGSDPWWSYKGGRILMEAEILVAEYLEKWIDINGTNA